MNHNPVTAHGWIWLWWSYISTSSQYSSLVVCVKIILLQSYYFSSMPNILLVIYIIIISILRARIAYYYLCTVASIGMYEKATNTLASMHTRQVLQYLLYYAYELVVLDMHTYMHTYQYRMRIKLTTSQYPPPGIKYAYQLEQYEIVLQYDVVCILLQLVLQSMHTSQSTPRTECIP